MKKAIKAVVAMCVAIAWADNEPMSLDSCMRRAVENNGSLKNIYLSSDISKQEVRIAKGRLLPQITGRANIQNEFARPPQDPTDPIYQYTTSFGAELNIPLIAMASWSALEASLQEVKASELEIVNAQNKILTGAAGLYLSIQSFNVQLDVIDIAIEKYMRLEGEAKNRELAGASVSVDTERLIFARRKLQSQRRAIELQKQIVGNKLKLLLAIPESDTVLLSNPDTLVNIGSVKDRLESRIQDCRTNPNTQRLALLLSAKEKYAQAARRAHWPVLAAFGSWYEAGVGNSFRIGNPEYGYYHTGIVGLTIQVPIYNGMQSTAKAKQADLAARISRNQLADAKEMAEIECGNVRKNIDVALDDLSVSETNLELAQHIATITESYYQVGRATATDLMDSENSYREAKIQKINALLNLRQRVIELDGAEGHLMNDHGKSETKK